MAGALLRRSGFRWIALAATLAWAALLFIAFFPGVMSSDSLGQYAQGLGGQYSELYPPFVSWLYGLSGRASGSLWPVLLAQLAALGGGMLLLALRAPEDRRPGVLAALLLFLALPPVWSLAVTLWKDVMMAAALLGAVAAVDRRSPALALLALAVACLARYNGLIAALPLALAAGAQLAQWAIGPPASLGPSARNGDQPGLGEARRNRDDRLAPTGAGAWLRVRLVGWRRLAAIAASGALVALVPSGVNWLFRPQYVCMSCQIPAHDLAGLYVERKDLLAGSIIGRELSSEELEQVYHPHVLIPLFFHSELKTLDFHGLGTRRRELYSEWASGVASHPLIYARNRLRLFRRLLGADTEGVFYPFHVGDDPNPWGFRVRDHTLLHRFFRWAQETCRDGLFFRGWFWLASAAALAMVAARREGWRSLPATVAASGFFYCAAFLLIGPAGDFRYHCWTMVSVCASLLLLLRGSERSTAERG
ncbi:MAG: hypothetical protein HYZ28_15140 [Myxococcales bacterium]|nr:hypothetical protein [Myxococcales bacterium]